MGQTKPDHEITNSKIFYAWMMKDKQTWTCRWKDKEKKE